ncbi:putative zinc metalloprotease YwhC [candidate division SR1 bacterium]|nr:putative zinc metalloprotease YwhC [candidate division SR1 bacterium]
MIVSFIYPAIILLISIGMHEYAHAFSSYKLGDPTPKMQDRLSPNPIKHLDPIGFFLIFLIGFGRGKPVQINPMYYKKPLRDELITALAGPAMNLTLAIAGMTIMMIYARLMGIDLQTLIMQNFDLVTLFWMMFITINIGLAIFNLIPIFPLDGYRLVKIFWTKGAVWMEQHAMMISVVLLVFLLGPGKGIVGNYIIMVTSKLYDVFFMIGSQIFY